MDPVTDIPWTDWNAPAVSVSDDGGVCFYAVGGLVSFSFDKDKGTAFVWARSDQRDMAQHRLSRSGEVICRFMPHGRTVGDIQYECRAVVVIGAMRQITTPTDRRTRFAFTFQDMVRTTIA